jgi:5-methylthioadenosine/S-adenosylhomocysteine deaminase
VNAAALLIENALIVAAGDGMLPFVGWVAVSGTRISAVGAGVAPPMNAARRVDATGCALLPGLVNTHAHSHSSLTRGSAEGLALERWIETIEREQTRLSDDDAYAAALATYGEALLSGTTTVMDMCLRPGPALRAAQEIGIRVVVAPYVLDGRAFAPTLADVRGWLEAQRASLAAVAAANPPAGVATMDAVASSPAAVATADTGGPRTTVDAQRDADAAHRVQVWVGLHDLESCSDATLREGAALAAEFGVGLHLHCSESRFSVERTRSRTGSTPIAHLHTLGALGPRTVLAHCVWADAADQALLASTGTSVAHCPHANLKLASGFAPVPAMRQAGVTVSLATDGAKANNRLDLFDVMKFASLIHKGVALDAAVLPPDVVIGMATRDGAQALGIPAGRVSPGLLADLTLVDLRQFHLQPATPLAVATNLVHAARGSDVRLVMVDGVVVVEDGKLTRVDGAACLAAMQAAAERLL